MMDSIVSDNPSSLNPPATKSLRLTASTRLPFPSAAFRRCTQDGEPKAKACSQNLQRGAPGTVPKSRASSPQRPNQEEEKEEQVEAQESRDERTQVHREIR